MDRATGRDCFMKSSANKHFAWLPEAVFGSDFTSFNRTSVNREHSAVSSVARTCTFFFGCSERFSSTVDVPRKVVVRCLEGRRSVGKPRGRWDDGVWICSGNIRRQQGKQKFEGRRVGVVGPWPSNGQKCRRVRNRKRGLADKFE